MLSGHASAGSAEGTAASSETAQEEANPPRTEDNATTAPVAAAAASAVAQGTKEGSSTSSGEEDLPVVEEKPAQQQLLPPHPFNMVEPRSVATRVAQPADNSETDSADEIGVGSQNAAAEAQAANANHPNVNRSNGNIGQVLIDVMQPPKRVLTGSMLQEALTVRDLVSGVIESQLKRADPHGMPTPLGVGSPVYPPGPSESPTITSILKDSQRNYAVGRSSAPLTIVTNTPPAPSPRLMMPQPPEAKQQTILVIDPSSAVSFSPVWFNFMRVVVIKTLPSCFHFIAASFSPSVFALSTTSIGYGTGPSQQSAFGSQRRVQRQSTARGFGIPPSPANHLRA